MHGEELLFGFNEINENDPYVFLIDDVTTKKNRLKLLFFITNFEKFVLDHSYEIMFYQIIIPDREGSKEVTGG